MSDLFDRVETTLKHREEDYGEAGVMLAKISLAWSAYLGSQISPIQVAHMMALLKILRSTNKDTANTQDDVIDAVGYLQLGWEEKHAL